VTATERGALLRSTAAAGGGLLNLSGVAARLGLTRGAVVRNTVARSDFPKALVVRGGYGKRLQRVWLAEEVERFAREHPRQPTGRRL
jgi:hypothetical protein